MRELPPPDALLRPRDRERAEYVHASTHHCHHCDPDGPVGAATTVDWLSRPVGYDGRCRECGQKFVLRNATDRRLGHDVVL